jgi:hypothetical protein
MSAAKNFEDTSNSLGVIEFKVGRSRYLCEDESPDLWRVSELGGIGWMWLGHVSVAKATPKKLYSAILELKKEII